MANRRSPVSVVCVFNDADVRRDCLDRSVSDGLALAPGTDLVAVDNTTGRFASAGAALNHGVSLARNAHVALVHQDVYLHSLPALEEAAAILGCGEFGLLGAVGMTRDGHLVGRIRDRVVLSGRTARTPREVDSLDEVLFMASREQLIREPLAESPDLAWHAYAVEYGLRVRGLGRRVGAIHLPVTHNSLSVNLDRLDAAHAAVAAMYPDVLPVRTTCGTVASPAPRRPLPRPIEAQRWRYRWVRESLAVRPAHRAARDVPVVLSDIRHEIDDVLECFGRPLPVVNLELPDDRFTPGSPPLDLTRRGRPLSVRTATLEELIDNDVTAEGSALVTNVRPSDLTVLIPALEGLPLRLGFQEDAGLWLATGALAEVELAGWRRGGGRPLLAAGRAVRS
ncbi:hypothetical protein EDD32_0508 [Georgenia muralis]|uniref:Glycosyl transferase family 2 n=1 Tax=Georgenia muralis TaxID=154117 RepID=A0A3N4Z2M3_9MICO|nr:hypothetical protein EDD32_0508 [Georgenia muralis]